MEQGSPQAYSRIVKEIGQILALIRLYSLEHPVAKTEIEELVKDSLMKRFIQAGRS